MILPIDITLTAGIFQLSGEAGTCSVLLALPLLTGIHAGYIIKMMPEEVL